MMRHPIAQAAAAMKPQRRFLAQRHERRDGHQAAQRQRQSRPRPDPTEQDLVGHGVEIRRNRRRCVVGERFVERFAEQPVA